MSEIDLGALQAWMDDRGVGTGPVEIIGALGGGTQNVMFRLRRGETEIILRRPPWNKRKGSDDAMRREARVLEALNGTSIPHPTLIAACPDDGVIGAAFFLMAPVNGFNPFAEEPSEFADDRDAQTRLGVTMAEGLARLGELDHVEIGLADLGKADNWLERQVGRWRWQLDSYRELDGYDGFESDAVGELGKWLEHNRPSTWSPGLIHGDYYVGNVMASRTNGELVAIVDWELTTIGDPLLDLGHLLATWPEPGEHRTVPGPATLAHVPTRDDLISSYTAITTRDLGDLIWFRVLACYRMGIILEGSYARAVAGLAPKDVGEALHGNAVRLFEHGQALIG